MAIVFPESKSESEKLVLYNEYRTRLRDGFFTRWAGTGIERMNFANYLQILGGLIGLLVLRDIKGSFKTRKIHSSTVMIFLIAFSFIEMSSSLIKSGHFQSWKSDMLKDVFKRAHGKNLPNSEDDPNIMTQIGARLGASLARRIFRS